MGRGDHTNVWVRRIARRASWAVPMTRHERCTCDSQGSPFRVVTRTIGRAGPRLDLAILHLVERFCHFVETILHFGEPMWHMARARPRIGEANWQFGEMNWQNVSPISPFGSMISQFDGGLRDTGMPESGERRMIRRRAGAVCSGR